MQRKWYWGLIFIICAGLLSGPALAADALVNVGVLSLRNSLMAQGDLVPEIYPRYDVLPDNASQSCIVEHLRRAVDLDSGDYTARWALGRAALAAGDAETAAAALAPLADQHQNPFLYGDVVIALGRAGQYERVTELYESAPPPQPMQTISDTVALAYLGQGDRDALERAIALRPADLYANYFLWKWAQEERDIATTATYSDTLVYFPLEAIDPTDERFLDYAAKVIPDLLEEGLWDRDKTLNVVSFLVWQHNGARGVERLLGQLIAHYPTEPDWPFYLAELYHRRGDLRQAETAYRQVLAVDPTYAQAYLRLGMVAEAGREGESLSEAARWYAQYHSLAPDDLLGLKRLVEVCTTLGEAGVEDPSCRETVTLRQELDARTNDRRIVAEMLGVPVEDVELGPNLVENGGFEEWVEGRPEWWVWSDMFNHEPFNTAVFVGGADELLPFEGQRAARVDGFWVQQREGKSAARAGFWQFDEIVGGLRSIPLTANTPYVLSFQYRTSRVPNGRVTVWVSSTDEPDVFWPGGDHGLVGTNGMWYHFVAAGWNRSNAEAAIRPLLRLYAPGCAELDDVQVRPIGLPEGFALEQSEGQFRVAGRDN